MITINVLFAGAKKEITGSETPRVDLDSTTTVPERVMGEIRTNPLDPNYQLSVSELVDIFDKNQNAYRQGSKIYGAHILAYRVDMQKPLNEKLIIKEINIIKEQASRLHRVVLVRKNSDLVNPQITLEQLQAFAKKNGWHGQVFTISSEGPDSFYDQLHRLSFEVDSLRRASLSYAVNNLLGEKDCPQGIKDSLDAFLQQFGRESKGKVIERDIKSFEQHCHNCLNALPMPTKQRILKAVAAVVVAAVVTAIAAMVGFGIGFAAGVWMGPGAFISAIAAGSAAATAVAGTSAGFGTGVGVLAARSLFKPYQPLEKALNQVCQEARKFI